MRMTPSPFSHTGNPKRATQCLVACALLLALAPTRAPAQAPASSSSEQPAKKPPTAQTHPNNPEMWNTDAMMEEAVTQIARRYNLNTAQENYTRLLLTKRTRAFLEVYEPDVRELLKESIEWRMGSKTASAESYIKWAARAAPIYLAASKAILEGNEEWDAILNEEQKKIHEADVSLMKGNFTQITRTMDDWKAGNTPIGRPQGSAPVQGDGQTGIATGPKPGEVQRVSPNPPMISRQHPEDSWLAYVNLFIDTYKLDEKQSVAAREKIHKETRELATRYRDKRKQAFEDLDKEAKSAPKNGSKDQAAKRALLERPLHEMFITLDRRLDQLLDSKQRTAFNPEKKKQLDDNFQALAGKSREDLAKEEAGESVKLQTVAASSQPAKAEPAKGERAEKSPSKAETSAASKPSN